MKTVSPTLDLEKKLWSKGLAVVGGLDEVGRGAWAGPVVTAVVVLPRQHKQIDLVRDSKLLSAKQRQKLYDVIISEADDFGIGIIDHRVIDKVGIGESTKLAARDAVNMLKKPLDYLLVDAIDLSKHCNCQCRAIVKGDQKIYSISCASIVAKVTRDNLMSRLGPDYEKYCFDLHKGYGTKKHQDALCEYGPCDIHRYSYAPIKRYI
jgi:ribonuclease HII